MLLLQDEREYMKKEKTIKMKAAAILLIVLFLVLSAVTALYPFDNRNLTYRFMTDQGEYTILKTNLEISQESAFEFLFEQTEHISIQEVTVYGQVKSMLLAKWEGYAFADCVDAVGDGEKQYTDDGIVYTGKDCVRLYMNEAFQNKSKELSASFFLERMILEGILLVIFCIGWMGLKVLEETGRKECRDNHGPVHEMKKFAHDILDYGQYMVYAARTDLKAEVANSYLNRLWWLLEPFFNMVVYVIVFGQVMGNSIRNYATFVYSALLMWNLFSKTINYSVKLVRNNKDIVTKVYVPKFILLLSDMILNIFKLLFSLIVLVVMMVIFRIPVGLQTLLVLPVYLVLLLFAFGIGMIFLHFGVYVDDLSYAVGILLNMLMFLSGVFYDVMTTLPEPLNMCMMVLNPVAMLVTTMRSALLYHTAVNVPVLVIWGILSVLLCCVGVHIVYKNENSYVKVV